MGRPPPPPAAVPTFRTAVDRFLTQPRFAPRTRDSYGRDLAPLVARLGDGPVTGLTSAAVAAFLAGLAHLAPATFNRRYAAVRSLVRWCTRQGWLDHDPLAKQERRPQPPREPRALDPAQVEAVLGGIRDRRDRALFWLLYDGGLRCHEALAIDIEEIDWGERAIRIHGKGDRPRDLFFSRRVARYLDDYLIARGAPTQGPLFATHRRARNPRRADLTAEGYARLSYRQADTRWKHYTPGWDLHQLRHTAISARAARGYTEVELKRFSGHRSLRSLERYIADNREAAKRKAREWERRMWPDD
jgi:integrase